MLLVSMAESQRHRATGQSSPPRLCVLAPFSDSVTEIPLPHGMVTGPADRLAVFSPCISSKEGAFSLPILAAICDGPGTDARKEIVCAPSGALVTTIE